MRIVAILLGLLAPLTAYAVAVDERRLEDPQAEARARDIMADIRCLVCQNQSIEDSNAPLARDLRQVVRDQVALGKPERQVKQYLVDRYGDWVLLDPPFNVRTALLWLFAPLLLLIVVGAALYRAGRRRPIAAAAPLTPEERGRLNAALQEEERP